MECRFAASKSYALFVLFLVLNCYTDCGSDAQVLPEEEVQALKVISTKLGSTHWNIRNTYCSNGGDFNVTFGDKILRDVTCKCNSSVCHIATVQLKGLNLTGVLPAAFANLTHLTEIDLCRNYNSGTIPTRFSQLPLVILSLLGNRLSGSIPEEIGDIATLQELILEDNLFGGPLPQKLGNLRRCRRLLLSANNFT